MTNHTTYANLNLHFFNGHRLTVEHVIVTDKNGRFDPSYEKGILMVEHEDGETQYFPGVMQFEVVHPAPEPLADWEREMLATVDDFPDCRDEPPF